MKVVARYEKQILYLLCVISILLICVPMLNMIAVNLSTEYYGKCMVESKNIRTFLSILFIISLILTIFFTVQIVFFLCSDLLDHVLPV